MVSLTELYNIKESSFEKTKEKPVKEIVGILTIGAIIKKFIDKNPQMLDKLKDFVNNL
jgi:hypothetical protein